MRINFREANPLVMADEEPERVIIDVPTSLPVYYSGAKDKQPAPQPVLMRKGPAVARYDLPPGVWSVGSWWEVSLFQNGSKKPWCVAIRNKRPFAVLTVPTYVPPRGTLRVVK